MKNKTIASLLALSLGLCIFVAILGSELSQDGQDMAYSIGGLGLIVFGIMASYRLNKLPDQQ